MVLEENNQGLSKMIVFNSSYKTEVCQKKKSDIFYLKIKVIPIIAFLFYASLR